jgi:hypothetical protein
MVQTPGAPSLLTDCRDRIHAHGPASGYDAGRHRDDHENGGDDQKEG